MINAPRQEGLSGCVAFILSVFLCLFAAAFAGGGEEGFEVGPPAAGFVAVKGHGLGADGLHGGIEVCIECAAELDEIHRARAEHIKEVEFIVDQVNGAYNAALGRHFELAYAEGLALLGELVG